ncbi:lysophospholipase L1 [Rubidibacter lacunae KORDI 51-2]|uniref:Lysophospholipase L1 n=1 Tax=Rubidibacter lacunae KORDI 51-2 TaxID=582515 RepID=U5DGH4_9CHRO|nr:GDSL-type esterase/lipase family protein [Rubidibacter lacunae]ERN40387.1 lysophospholipase L1 [Rubidibacter lacunae KORDI 51-2]
MTVTVEMPIQLVRSKGPHLQRIAAIGDSLIYGFGDSEGGGWVERLRCRWLDPAAPGPAVYNLGVRGDRVGQVAARFEREVCGRGELRRQVPDLAIVSVGVNDSARLGRPDGRLYTPIETFATDLENLLAIARDVCPVLFVGMVPVNDTRMPFAGSLYFSLAEQRRYRDVTRGICARRRVPYLDTLALWEQRGRAWWQAQLCPDGLHPNVGGYRVLLADVLAWEALCPYGLVAPGPSALERLPAGVG